jgi:hypothetical protein
MGIGNPNQSIGLNTGVMNPHDFGLPQLRIHGFAFLGTSPYSSPKDITERHWQLEEEYNKIFTPHTIKLGYAFHRAALHSLNDVNYRGVLEFESVRDFLAGNIAAGTIGTGDSHRNMTQNIESAFVQDQYQWTAKISLSFGLRWEYFGIQHEEHNLLSKYDPSRGLVNVRDLYHSDFSNFSPRLGIAWQLGVNTVLRANAGRFFDSVPEDYLMGQVEFNTFNAGAAYNAIPQAPIFHSRSPIKILQVGTPIFPLATFASDTRDVWTVHSLPTPYVFNFGVDMQQEVFGRAVFQVAYVGSMGRKLARVRDINSPLVPGGTRPFATAAPLSPAAPNPPFIENQLESSSTSSFNSLQLTFRQHNDWHHWQNFGGWVWSHSIDDASAGIDWTPNMALPNRLGSTAQERASSSFDQRHTVMWQSSYDFPYSGASPWLKSWRIDGRLAVRSGQPYHVNFAEEFDTQGAYDFILRPDLVGDPFLGTSAPYRILNLAAFRVPCTLDGLGTTVSDCIPGTLHFGNLPRNAFVGPDIRKLDVGVSKSILFFREKCNLQLRVEALNVTNHPIFASPLLPRYISLASVKGISLNGLGGAAGVGCNTRTASVDCYLPETATPDGADNSPSQGRGARTLQISAKFSF